MDILFFKWFYLSLFVLILSNVVSSEHPCVRTCNSQPMTCEYDFTFEQYVTMSKACYDCPFVKSDCFREDCIAADGFPRDISVVNRKLPGPEISVCHNDTIVVRVHNMMDSSEGVTVHWHGLYQRGSQWMDGVPMVTQCPIPVFTSFKYTFVASPSAIWNAMRYDDPMLHCFVVPTFHQIQGEKFSNGTFWWHSHSGFQRGDGMTGPLIIRTPPEQNPHIKLYDIDNDNYTLVVRDWLHRISARLYLTDHHVRGTFKMDGILINGRGQDQSYQVNESVYYTPMTEFVVEKGLRYRFRLINDGAGCPLETSIDQHVLTVIATDGKDVEPYNVTSILSHSGERYDFVLTANQNPASYWLNVTGYDDCSDLTQSAIVRYSSTNNDAAPTPSSTSSMNKIKINAIKEDKETEEIKFVTALKSLHEINPRLKGSPDEVYFLGFGFKKVDNPFFHNPASYSIFELPSKKTISSSQINNVTWLPPSSPLLTQPSQTTSSHFCGSHVGPNVTANSFRKCTHAINVQKNRLVELVVFDERSFSYIHPMHLHGQHFAVVAMDKLGKPVTLNEMKQLHENGSIQYNLDQPVMKDTIMVPDDGFVVLRFISDNPGVWSFHCHVLSHLREGMMMVFQVGSSDDITGIPTNFPKCGNWLGPSSASTQGNGGDDALAMSRSNWIVMILGFFIVLRQP